MTIKKSAGNRKRAPAKAKVCTSVIAYKGFDAQMRCRGMQFEVGKTYTHNGAVEACKSGFHACEYPLDVLQYYAPASNRYAVVEQSGALSRHSDDTKIASATITITAELHLNDLIQHAVKWVFERAKAIKGCHTTGYRGAASSTGDRGAASSTGDQGAASSTGYRGAASSTGYRGAASSTGYEGAASSTGDRGAAMASGYKGRAMGAVGNALFLVERNDNYEIVAVWAGIVGRDEIKAGVWYTLQGGEPVEAQP